MSATLLVDIAVGGLITGGTYALVALGLNLHYGLMRVLNVAHGEFLMIGAYLTYSLHAGSGMNDHGIIVIPLVWRPGRNVWHPRSR